MTESRYIPGGRGDRRGDDAFVDQLEGDLLRQKTSSQRRGWTFPEAVTGYTYGYYTSVQPVNATAMFTALGFLDYDMIARRAKTWVFTPQAASYQIMALYVWNFEKRHLIKVPGTEVTFDTSIANRSNANVDDVLLHAGKFYFLASLPFNDKVNVPHVACWTVSPTGAIAVRSLSSQTKLHGMYPWDAFSVGSSQQPLNCYYCSIEGDALLA